jgi:hypothetical protein
VLATAQDFDKLIHETDGGRSKWCELEPLHGVKSCAAKITEKDISSSSLTDRIGVPPGFRSKRYEAVQKLSHDSLDCSTVAMV